MLSILGPVTWSLEEYPKLLCWELSEKILGVADVDKEGGLFEFRTELF